MSFFSTSTETWLIVGLGNPGKEYVSSRHNTGFQVLDALAEKLSVKVGTVRFHALCGSCRYERKKLILMKPETYMNASGIAVEAAAHFYHVQPCRIIVLFDDISLPVGKIRVRANGSAGGHNGIKSIISSLGSDSFPRVKIGVGAKPNPDYDLADWVLGDIAKDDLPEYRKAIQNAAEAALCILTDGCERAASNFNGK